MKQTFALLMLLFLVGCTTPQPPGDSYLMYYPVEQHTFAQPALKTESYFPADDATETEALITQLLNRLLLPPESEALYAVIPAGVAVEDWTLEDGVLYIAFSWQYGFLSGIDLTLADYSVTLTLSQVPGVEQVVTTVEGESLAYRQDLSLQEDQILMTLQPPTEP